MVVALTLSSVAYWLFGALTLLPTWVGLLLFRLLSLPEPGVRVGCYESGGDVLAVDSIGVPLTIFSEDTERSW